MAQEFTLNCCALDLFLLPISIYGRTSFWENTLSVPCPRARVSGFDLSGEEQTKNRKKRALRRKSQRSSCARSRSAREVMLTRYAMYRVELVEKLPCRPEFSFFRVFKALTDSFLGIGLGGNVEQMLIGFSVVNDGRGLAIHRKHHRALSFFSCLIESPDRRWNVPDLQEFENGRGRSGPPRLEISGN
jgi:hypothetical protein